MRKHLFRVADKLRENHIAKLNEVAEIIEEIAEKASDDVVEGLYEVLR